MRTLLGVSLNLFFCKRKERLGERGNTTILSQKCIITGITKDTIKNLDLLRDGHK